MSIDYAKPSPTNITIRPEPQTATNTNDAFWRKPIQKATLGDQSFAEMVEGKGGTDNGSAKSSPSFWGDDGFGLDDLIDLINPLQHIPIVSTIYRAITGDTIAAGPQLIGGAAFGGVVGAAVASGEIMFQQAAGGDIGSTVASAFQGEDATTNTAARDAYDKAPVKNQAQQAARVDIPTARLQPSPELESLDLTGASFTAQDVAQAAAAMPLPTRATSQDKSQTLLDLYSASRTKSQEAYAKSQGLITAQNAARDLKF